MFNRSLIALALCALVAFPGALLGQQTSSYVTVDGTDFKLNGRRFYVTGVNNHYLPWASQQELERVLDDAVAMNANVVRTFLQPVIGSLDNVTVPTIWNFRNNTGDSGSMNVHGNYLLYWDPAKGGMAINTGPNGMQMIDRLIVEADKRGLKLIISMLDFWSYTGGAQQMRAWYGSKDEKTFFFRDPRTIADYRTWLAFVLNRTNSISGRPYREDGTIFAWELMNEPQAPLPLRRVWMDSMSKYIKSLDPNHLVGSGEDHINLDDFTIPGLDFVTWHGYPKWYGITADELTSVVKQNCDYGLRYRKPVLLEEFGHAKSATGPTQAEAYKAWLSTMASHPGCAGWLVWRLVSPQDNGALPDDSYDHFDVYNDGGDTWNALKAATAPR